MKLGHVIAMGVLAAALAAPAGAQSVKKVADDVHHTLKKAGNDTKAAAKKAGSAVHHGLKTGGNEAKEEAGEATGVHKVGGDVGKAAKKVSHYGKKHARKAKHHLKKSSSKAHHGLKETGRAAKDSLKAATGDSTERR